MPITCEDLLSLAESLSQGDAATEVELRAAASRSYYAAFHAVMPLVEQLPESRKMPRTADHVSHDELTERLREWRSPAAAAAALKPMAAVLLRQIVAARAMRVKADYRLGSSFGSDVARTQIERSAKIVRQSRDLLRQLTTQPVQAA